MLHTSHVMQEVQLHDTMLVTGPLTMQHSAPRRGCSAVGVSMVRGWHSNPLDLDPFHHLWGLLKPRMYKMKLKDIHELDAAVLGMWEWVPHGMLSRLVASGEARQHGVVALRGGYTSR
jgi:hypothetical protein